jgi:hypothetical protein
MIGVSLYKERAASTDKMCHYSILLIRIARVLRMWNRQWGIMKDHLASNLIVESKHFWLLRDRSKIMIIIWYMAWARNF